LIAVYLEPAAANRPAAQEMPLQYALAVDPQLFSAKADGSPDPGIWKLLARPVAARASSTPEAKP
jgi:hypothetical protein